MSAGERSEHEEVGEREEEEAVADREERECKELPRIC
jgi:hypothetical protein